MPAVAAVPAVAVPTAELNVADVASTDFFSDRLDMTPSKVLMADFRLVRAFSVAVAALFWLLRIDWRSEMYAVASWVAVLFGS
ncbi:hypothetical protein GCM10011572_06340 [Pseudoduganella buxea]|uniref:FUSC family protein n=1 Tax=Pseudoduganella buxea TaxID=1949069 RepID=A0ABQ1K7T2_9BURK|nr:hypothetical protein GCM10011572_06340 [Pseudoduganella buxea]